MKIRIWQDYVGNSLMQIAYYLRFNTEFVYSSDIKEKNTSLKSQDRAIDLCTVMGTTQYINAINGMDLYSKERFAECNIKLSFLKTLPHRI